VSQLGGPQDLVTKLLDSQQPGAQRRRGRGLPHATGAYSTTIDETIAKIEHDRRLGVVPPGFVLDKAIATLAPPHAGDPAQHPLVVALATKARDAGLPQPDAWTKRASALVANGVLRPTHGWLPNCSRCVRAPVKNRACGGCRKATRSTRPWSCT